MKNRFLPLFIAVVFGLLAGGLIPLAGGINAPQKELIALREEVTRLNAELQSQQSAYLQLELAYRQMQEASLVALSDVTDAKVVEDANETANLSTEEATKNQSPTSDVNIMEVLRALGLNQAELQQVKQEVDRLRLARLDLRNRAIRENWFGTQRYYKDLRTQNNENRVYRNLLGEDRYDQFLYNIGQSNRVQVSSVMTGSVAEHNGINVGDIILSYGEKRVFGWSELSLATTEGRDGENVRLTLIRDGNVIDIYVPRGPLGVSLAAISVEP